MKQLLLISLITALCACAAQEGAQKVTAEDTENQAIVDFISVRGLEEVDRIRTTDQDGWNTLTMTYIIYNARRDRYLLEFARPCYELRDHMQITPDVRADANTIRAKFDTLRGCRIGRVYLLNESEAEELQNIGEAPGNRN